MKNSRNVNPRSKEWVLLSSTQVDLEGMVVDGILPDQATAGWCAAVGERFPNPANGELVVFEDFYRRGFGLLVHPFLRKLLDYYGITLIHLNPNSILHLSIFINICEEYLDIDLHFILFHYFFHLKSFLGSKLVGWAYLVL